MMKAAVIAALFSVAAATFDYGLYGQGLHGCHNEPRRPRTGADTCDWRPIKHPWTGCIVRWKCRAVDPGSKPCPEAPARPTEGRNCNWVTMRDERGCIVDYECEPVTQPPCPRRPQRPDNTPRCYYRAIKNNDGCVIDYECEPIRGRPFPILRPRPIIAAPQPIIAAPPPIAPFRHIAAPIPTASFDAAAVNQVRAIQAQAQARNAAVLAAAHSAAATNVFAPRIPILKDDTDEGAPEEWNARKGGRGGRRNCIDRDDSRDNGIPNCETWTAAGECNRNKPYMETYCARSCEVC